MRREQNIHIYLRKQQKNKRDKLILMVEIYSKEGGRNDVLLLFVCRSLEKSRTPDITLRQSQFYSAGFLMSGLCLADGRFSTGREGSSLQGCPRYGEGGVEEGGRERKGAQTRTSAVQQRPCSLSHEFTAGVNETDTVMYKHPENRLKMPARPV